HGAGLTRRDFAISDADKNSARRLAARVGIHRLLRIPPLAAVARTILFNYTGAFRILVGEKPAA
ncbi:hypothetical protein HY256_06750, partial [Candidatus Sumerlaeota bacterium]|nr:hypothetical protein [Candidatus Sumerlaeota bacterium]